MIIVYMYIYIYIYFVYYSISVIKKRSLREVKQMGQVVSPAVEQTPKDLVSYTKLVSNGI